MNKQDFLNQLKQGLRGLPREDAQEHLTFYAEMIEDRMEEGLSEEDAVKEMGSVDSILSKIYEDTPYTKPAKEEIAPKRRLSPLEIVLLILGSPLWISLLATTFAVVISLYAALWSVIISLWACFASLEACSLGFLGGGILLAATGHGLTGLALIGAALLLAGLSIFWFFGCRAATEGTVRLTKQFPRVIKRAFRRKENVR